MRHLTVGEAIAKRKHLTIYPFVGVLMLSQAPFALTDPATCDTHHTSINNYCFSSRRCYLPSKCKRIDPFRDGQRRAQTAAKTATNQRFFCPAWSTSFRLVVT
ncbi:unnamed protein product [Porites lobata]|uniref:Secreted protein n=1 Tax=Porites lobata TaxID=104759 RepID=A0ABN8PLP9_9CNID|nr:unnamed protein product [Porites lobata]